MASLLRLGLNICARRVPTLHASANNARCVQRRLASNQPTGSSSSMVLPVVGSISLALVLFYVYDVWTFDTTPIIQPRRRDSNVASTAPPPTTEGKSEEGDK